MRSGYGVHMDVVLNLASQQIAMLESDLLWRALEMDIGPTTFIELVCVFQARIGRVCAGRRDLQRGQKARGKLGRERC
jgi:hypothetical protein